MARSTRDPRLETRTARLELAVRREPYWKSIQKGLAVGYRKVGRDKAGSWICRAYDPIRGRQYKSLAPADDFADADGSQTLSFDQAQEKARHWFAAYGQLLDGEHRHRGRYTVRLAGADYLADYRVRGRAITEISRIVDCDIVPTLGEIEIGKLTTRRIRDWHNHLASTRAPIRTKKGEPRRFREPMADAQEEGRRRKVTANHKLTVLKALLNHAFRDKLVGSDAAWKIVRPFKGVNRAVVRYLTQGEAELLVRFTEASFRPMVQASLLTGCRYQELTHLRCADLNFDSGMALVRDGKGGKARHVVLTTEAVLFFKHLVQGRPNDAFALPRPDGKRWGKNQQQRPIIEACELAGIKPAVSIHVLRHTHASWLAMKGVSLSVIAAQLGHSDTRITEKHYAHLAPNYIAETIRAAFPRVGIESVEDRQEAAD